MSDTRSALHVLVLAPGERPADTVQRALAHLSDEGRAPHEIHVAATRERISDLQRDLLTAGAGTARFAALCAAAGFARDEIVFNQRTLHAIDAQGPDGCSAGADLLLQLLRKLSSSDDASLTVVVAEDAGAAGYLLHACLEVAGRVSDRLLLDVAASAARRRRGAVSARPTAGTSRSRCSSGRPTSRCRRPMPKPWSGGVSSAGGLRRRTRCGSTCAGGSCLSARRR